jgi:hypothetical protein
MVSAFQDLYSTDIRWFSLVRMLNRAFDLKSHMELFLEMRGTPFPGFRNDDWMRKQTKAWKERIALTIV